MDSPRPRVDPADLLAHLEWVQRLARALARDAAAAEDLAQDAVRVTLEQPAERIASGAAMRAWLGGVVRRLALDRSRADRSRAARERAIAPPEPTATTFEVVARSARQQRVVQAVMELAEPYRSTVLYRYLDDLPTRAVAARTGASEELVRKRLERALAQLRERLDREFGAPTREWATAIFLLPGVAAMSVKSTVAVAAALLLGATLAWRVLVPPSAVPPGAHGPGGATIEAAAAEAPSLPERDAGPAAAQVTRRESPAGRAAAAGRGEGALLRVRVVGSDAHPRTEGRIDCFWLESHWFGHGERAHVLEVAIAGDVTEVDLPPSAGSVEVTASVAGEPPSPRVVIERLGLADDGARLPRRDVREVAVDLAEPPGAWTLSGRILVDGEPRVPAGLRVRSEGPWERARIHALEARYEVAVDDTTRHLFAVSGETVPRQLEVERGMERLDLELSTGRTLRLSVVDRADGRPLHGIELFVEVAAVVARESLFRELWREGSAFPVTDSGGMAIVRGIPARGRVLVRRDARTDPIEMRQEDGRVVYGERLRDPLLEIALEPNTPKVIEATLRLGAAGRRVVLRGALAPELRAEAQGAPGLPPLEVRWARLSEGRQPDVHEESVPLDAKGGFGFEVDAGAECRVWAERGRIRCSEVASVAAGDSDPAPFFLTPRAGTEVRLRVVRCPTSGFVSLFVEDPGAVAPRGCVLPAVGGEIERRLRLNGPTWISVGWEQERGLESGRQQRIRVDPATAALVEVDLEADGARPVELELAGATPPEESLLLLERLDAPRGTPVSVIHVFFRGARSIGPAAIEPGRYLALLHGLPGVVAAVIEIAGARPGVPIPVRFEVEAHARAQLGAGVQLDRIGPIDLDGSWRRICTLRFADRADLADAGTILLPAGARFTLLPP